MTCTVTPNAVAAEGTLSTDMLEGVPLTLQARATVTRIVGCWAARPLENSTTVGLLSGIYVLPHEAFTAGALLEPETDLASYMWTDMIYIRQWDLNTGSNNQYVQHQIDIKVKRKIRSVENMLVFTTQNTLADIAERAFYVRVLLQLP